jgi:nitrate/nitrite transport system ATP-binding protein
MITNNVEEAILLSDRIVPMVANGPATLGTPIRVELSRPRSVAQLARDEQATHVRAHVVATLTASLGRIRKSTAATAAAGVAAATVLERVAEEAQ